MNRQIYTLQIEKLKSKKLSALTKIPRETGIQREVESGLYSLDFSVGEISEPG